MELANWIIKITLVTDSKEIRVYLSAAGFLKVSDRGRFSLITEKSNSLIILSDIMPFSFSPTQPICFVLALRSPPKM
ncbi:hypothetical protein BpHYR1_052315 [Brachionus plicatilis]|uniref:Uncharacterized protein n=1 Tax=Brachionus plicatilis TaxID=10195 RepID=A0A3M7T342_BRAPC|nr:hypothetical protein BpHYR1_052315 [Brachionus plicatilis]